MFPVEVFPRAVSIRVCLARTPVVLGRRKEEDGCEDGCEGRWVDVRREGGRAHFILDTDSHDRSAQMS